jgi:transcriptional regulator
VFIPSHFRVTDTARLHEFIERNSFASLVTSHGGGWVVAGHIPLLLVRDGSSFGSLEGHVARGNDQWRDLTGEALAIFTGPHAYVSPRWYEAEEVVPTWNYVAVHAYGPMTVMRDPAELIGLLRRSIELFEGGAEGPWTLERSGGAVDQLLGGIVGFRIPIARIEGKWKLSQNHSPDRRTKVIAALEAQGDENSREIAALMRANLAT